MRSSRQLAQSASTKPENERQEEEEKYKTSEWGLFEITKKVFTSTPMDIRWAVKKLTQLINSKGNMWSSEGEVLKSSDCTAICRGIDKRITMMF